MQSSEITAVQLRKKYVAFFAERGHVTIPSASLVPANDPTVLFTTAGMHLLVPFLLGQLHPGGELLVNVQKCVRTGDIDDIGDDTHLTFFEMLGNWSLGDYYRQESIRWSFEFLTDARWLGLPVERLAVTCFAGDGQVPKDEESSGLWRRLGLPSSRIAFPGRADNWWGPAGNSGPCGPDTEIFYWVGVDPAPTDFDPSDKRWVEIWNNVFMGFNQSPTGEITPLERVNVDTGMGLERTLMALNGLHSVYEVDTVKPLYALLQKLAPSQSDRQLRVLTDHLRASSFMLADGVVPSNKDRGYVLRRLLRRAILFARQCELPKDWFEVGLTCLRESFGDAYPELSSSFSGLIREESGRFEKSIAHGLREISKYTSLDGEKAFDLFQTHGFPLELTREIAASHGTRIDEEGFNRELDRHREKSRTTTTGSFQGGLADHSAEIIRYHTLTHLLQAALRSELGAHVVQRGSNITHERLRFDFSHDAKVSSDQLRRVEARVNEWLRRELVVEREMVTQAQARSLGAIGAFGEKYGEIVSVHTVLDPQNGEVVSREFCGGPHVPSLRAIQGTFRIVREQAISAGIRRIKAVLAPLAPPGPLGEQP